MKAIRTVFTFALIALTSAAAGQVPPPPNMGGMRGVVGPRPLDMGEHDTLATPTERDQLSISTERARTERAARAARRAAGRAGRGRGRTPGQRQYEGEEQSGRSITAAADGAVVSANSGRVRVPLEFGIASGNLLLAMTKAEFDAIVSGANQHP